MRFLPIFLPNGAPDLWKPLTAGRGNEWQLSSILEPLQALKRGDVSVILSRAVAHLAGFVMPGRGDGFLAYNIPGRPVLDFA